MVLNYESLESGVESIYYDSLVSRVFVLQTISNILTKRVEKVL